MYKLSDLTKENNPSFLCLLTTKWDELHNNADVFRYKIDNLQEIIIDGKYLLQLNPNRRDKRRAPEEIKNICQPFDTNKFNFTKVLPEEILFSIENNDADIHTVIINVSPISKYHSLLCPSVNKGLPQVVTPESLKLAVEVVCMAQDRRLKIGFNSMCGFASVNHLHYHIFVEPNNLYVEAIKWQHLKDSIYTLDKTYPVPAFCFEVQKDSIDNSIKDIFKLLEHFLKKSIAHNILIILRENGATGVIIWPRKSTSGAKQLVAFNVAVLELSGWFPVFDAEDFKNLRAEDLEKELSKWHIEDFDGLCSEIQCL